MKPNKIASLLNAHAQSLRHGSPGRKMKIIGVFGRDGSTVTIAALAEILKTAGQRVGVITQDYVEIAGEKGSGSDQAHPIEDAGRLHSLLGQMRRTKCSHVLLELPSVMPEHQFAGLPLSMLVVRRIVDGYLDQVAVAASLAQFKKILKKANGGVLVLPHDDPGFNQIHSSAPEENTLTFGTTDRADARISQVRLNPKGCSIVLKIDTQTTLDLQSRLTGKQAIYSLSGAAAAAYMLHIPLSKIVKGVGKLPNIAKASQYFPTDRPYQIVLDSSVSPQGIAEVLESLRHFVKNRLLVVVSASLNQPTQWRSAVGEVVAGNADRVIVTDGDYNQDEDPAQIRQQIVEGVRRTGSEASSEEIPDRKQALQKALAMARRGDILVVCCSSQRPYRQVGSDKQKWSDENIFKEML